jgi:Holliday junction resolvase RusA-like endonuclease
MKKELLWKGYFPLPTSINETYIFGKRGVVLTQNAKTFCSYANAIIANERLGNKNIKGWLEIVVLIRLPPALKKKDSSSADAHNYHKLILDVLQNNNVYANDCMVSPVIVGFGDETNVPIRQINYIKKRASGNVAVNINGGCTVLIYQSTAEGIVDLSSTHDIPEISYKRLEGLDND